MLTKDAPLGDVVYGIDNTLRHRAPSTRACFADYTSDATRRCGRGAYAIPGSHALTPIDYSDVCINVDHR